MHGLPDGVPVGREIRPPDRGDAPAGRATRPPIVHGSRVPPIDIRDLSSSVAPARARVAAVGVPAIRPALVDPRQRLADDAVGPACRDGAAASRPVRIDTASSRGSARARPRYIPPPGWIAPRMRAARVLSTRQRRDRARPCRRGLRRRDAGRAGLLRRADAACRPRR
jgi:hypothetical protein